jgi:hypothetical protein
MKTSQTSSYEFGFDEAVIEMMALAHCEIREPLAAHAACMHEGVDLAAMGLGDAAFTASQTVNIVVPPTTLLAPRIERGSRRTSPQMLATETAIRLPSRATAEDH